MIRVRNWTEDDVLHHTHIVVDGVGEITAEYVISPDVEFKKLLNTTPLKGEALKVLAWWPPAAEASYYANVDALIEAWRRADAPDVLCSQVRDALTVGVYAVRRLMFGVSLSDAETELIVLCTPGQGRMSSVHAVLITVDGGYFSEAIPSVTVTRVRTAEVPNEVRAMVVALTEKANWRSDCSPLADQARREIKKHLDLYM